MRISQNHLSKFVSVVVIAQQVYIYTRYGVQIWKGREFARTPAITMKSHVGLTS